MGDNLVEQGKFWLGQFFKGKIIQALLPRDKEFDSASQMQPLGYESN